MPLVRVAFVFGLLLLAVVAQSRADEVDDLLSGKPTSLLENDASEPAPSIASEPLIGPEPLAEGKPWQLSVEPPAHRHLVVPTIAPQAERKPVPTKVNFVPEPSAIILAVLAMVYFLVFFRRRHLA